MSAFRASCVLAVLAAAAVLGGCSGSITDSPAGRAVVQAASSSVAVGDSMQLTAGVRYTDGRFVPFQSATITSSAPAIASYDPDTRYLRGHTVGATVITVLVPEVATFDTSFAVVAAAAARARR